MRYNSSNIRNIAVLGHQSSGKTSLCEALYQTANKLQTKGSIEKKNTISDYLPEEQKRLSSISTSLIPFDYEGYRMNLLDIPGNDDFISEVLSVTRVVKGAILVVDASSGVQVGTMRHWELLRKRNIPTIIYVNKMDKENVDFEKVLDEIRTKLGKIAIPFCYPLGHDNNFDGFVNVVDLKARIFNGKECVDAEIYEDKRAIVMEHHNTICEEVAKTDDELLEKFFSDIPLEREEIRVGLRKGVLSGELVPILVGSAQKNIGLHTMLSMFIDYMPNPSDLKAYEGHKVDGTPDARKTSEEEPFSAYIFKTTCDPYAGTISYLKVLSGVLRNGDEVYSPNSDKVEKVSSLFYMVGKTQVPVDEVGAGDIVCVSRLGDFKSGDTLCDPKKVIVYDGVKYPTAVIYKGMICKSRDEEGKLMGILQKLQIEDPAIAFKRNVETKQFLLGALSTTHIDFIVEKLKSNYRIDLTLEEEKTVYRESITGSADAEGRYVKQSGGSGFYGIVTMHFEPCEESKFEETIFGGAVPKNYFPAVEKGFFEALNQGLLAGFPVIGVKGVLTDGKYHNVDSNELSFKMAAILAFKEAYMKCKPVILEPIVRATISVNQDFIGAVLSDLNSRRGRVQSIDEGEHDRQEITALVPESEIKDYATKLKALTQGTGFFTREFESYERLPRELQDKVIKENSLLNK